ncbi:hypothetical protein DEO72_LG2g3148 [Vigna unguiculata]|uniref:Uncharacterized protein n=1 Tax=Vigna unguiculata TaxID=3917 RepID=A0A4D6L2P5_VIGUN|nr:hypothetical protein DEO72_LG2g3148 [Vigna unguiculata]
MFHYIPVPHHNIHTQPKQIIQNKQTSQHNIVSPNTSLRLRGFTQARRARSGELPFRLGEGSRKGTGNNAGSRLGETPLAWASCLLAQQHTLVAWATTRAENPGRTFAHFAWVRQARLGKTISVRHCSHLHNAYTRPTEIFSQSKHP